MIERCIELVESFLPAILPFPAIRWSLWEHMRPLIRDKNRSMTRKHKADANSTRKSHGNGTLLLDFLLARCLHPSSSLACSLLPLPRHPPANLFRFYYLESTGCILQFDGFSPRPIFLFSSSSSSFFAFCSIAARMYIYYQQLYLWFGKGRANVTCWN